MAPLDDPGMVDMAFRGGEVMPYIKMNDRKALDEGDWPLDPGSLNYVLTRTVENYIQAYGRNYTTFNEVLGVLEAMKLELYRREIAPYENAKLAENGDVYGPLT